MQTPQILIVEDEQVTRNTLKSIFEAEGYAVFEASDGEEMHQVLSENSINLVSLSSGINSLIDEVKRKLILTSEYIKYRVIDRAQGLF